jgi:hypothetical protein
MKLPIQAQPVVRKVRTASILGGGIIPSQNACSDAHNTLIGRLNNVLLENLILADGDVAEIRAAKEKFSRGMKFAKEVLDTCLAVSA